MDDIKRQSDRFTDVLQVVIRLAVHALAILMTVVIVLGVVDVAWQLHQKAMEPPSFILTISDMLGMFGAFMAMLITQVLHWPYCQGTDSVRHGTTPEGKQRYRCRACPDRGRTFLRDYAYAGQSPAVKQQIVEMARFC